MNVKGRYRHRLDGAEQRVAQGIQTRKDENETVGLGHGGDVTPAGVAKRCDGGAEQRDECIEFCRLHTGGHCVDECNRDADDFNYETERCADRFCCIQ